MYSIATGIKIMLDADKETRLGNYRGAEQDLQLALEKFQQGGYSKGKFFAEQRLNRVQFLALENERKMIAMKTNREIYFKT